jgi:excisionase family DNA binding protein
MLGDHMNGAERNDLLTPAEVAELFRVNPKTVTRWAKAGKISVVRTLGGHRRFRRSEVAAQLGAHDTVDV